MEESAYLTGIFKLTRANICSFLFSFKNINFWLGVVACILNHCIWKTVVDKAREFEAGLVCVLRSRTGSLPVKTLFSTTATLWKQAYTWSEWISSVSYHSFCAVKTNKCFWLTISMCVCVNYLLCFYMNTAFDRSLFWDLYWLVYSLSTSTWAEGESTEELTSSD